MPSQWADGAFRAQTSWGVELGSLRFAVTRTREGHGAPPATRRAGWPFGAGAVAGVGAVALAVAGASAAPRDLMSTRYVVSVPVPSPAARPLVRVAVPPRAGRVVPRATATPAPSGRRFDAADEPHVTRAMATGAFQEWEDAAGQRRFLTAGPVRAEGGRYCRDMALLVRLAEGGSRVRSTTRCTSEPIGDATDVDAVPTDD